MVSNQSVTDCAVIVRRDVQARRTGCNVAFVFDGLVFQLCSAEVFVIFLRTLTLSAILSCAVFALELELGLESYCVSRCTFLHANMRQLASRVSGQCVYCQRGTPNSNMDCL